jgi:hypothetical protein
MTQLTAQESRAIERARVQMTGQAWGISFGLTAALGIFVATMVLVLKGGPNVGQNLGLLAQYLPGYRVTFPGAFIGFIYLFVIGYMFGRLAGVVYNFVSRR